MTQNRKPSTVVVSDRDPGLPYSKGLMASRVMVTGLSAFRAYQVAERIEEVLLDRGSPTVTSRELGEVTVQVLREVAGERYAKNFVRWQQVERLDLPLVILIGGATGVGKSTIATQLAARLGIVRVVATDAVREVMRAMFSEDLMPSLHTSSFEAGESLREFQGGDRVIAGFREQTEAVSVGLKAFLERAAIEGTSVILEGAHMVPGFVDLEPWEGRVLGIPVVITVEDEDVHRSHFAVRGGDVSSRPAERYVRGFDNIRRIQKFTRSRALAHGVPVIPNYSLDQAIAAVVELVIERATEHVAGMPEPPSEEIVDLNPNGATAAQVLAPEQSPAGPKPVASTDGGAR
ncbi:MAG: 2-phosphoglycerate kinase [Actinomycetota bacterium]